MDKLTGAATKGPAARSRSLVTDPRAGASTRKKTCVPATSDSGSAAATPGIEKVPSEAVVPEAAPRRRPPRRPHSAPHCVGAAGEPSADSFWRRTLAWVFFSGLRLDRGIAAGARITSPPETT